jgi:outer membrane protein assembly factor BamB
VRLRLRMFVPALAAGLALLMSSPPAGAAGRSDDWPAFRYGTAHTGFNKHETTLGTGNVGQLVKAWTASTSGGSNMISSPAIAKGAVYVGAIDGTLRAFDAGTGGVLWTASPSNIPIDSSPAVAGGRVFIGVCDTMYAYDQATGGQEWSTTLDIQGAHGCDMTAPTVMNGIVYAGSYGSRGVHAFRATDGALLWSSVPTGGPIESSPAITRSKLFVGSDDGSVYAYPLNCSDPCSPLWSYPTGDMVTASPAVAGKWVYAASNDGYLYALRASNGKRAWRRSLGGPGLASPAVAGMVVYAAGTGGDLAAFKMGTGKVVWTDPFAGDRGSPAVANGVLYLSAFGNVEAFEAATGAFLWDGYVVHSTSSAAVANGMVFVNTDAAANGLWAFRLP